MWNFYQRAHVIWGEGEVKNIGRYMAEKGYTRGFMISDGFLVKIGLADKVKNWADGRIVGISSDVEPNPTIQNVNMAAKNLELAKADCIVALGGGSSMDCAKAAAAAAAENLEAEEMFKKPIEKALPIIAIPTTAGTGSEVTAGAVISNKEKGTKNAVFSPVLFPTIALVDPELTYSVPPKVTAATGMDVLAHSLDAMSSVKASEATDWLALCACKLVVNYLERAFTNGSDKEARAKMSKAGTIAGLAFSQTGTTGSHACSYILTSKYGVPHGEACAFTLDDWLVINAKEKPCINDYAKVLGFKDAKDMADWIGKMKEKFGMRTKLSQLGASEKDIDTLVDAAMSANNMSNDIAQIGRAGVEAIYRRKL